MYEQMLDMVAEMWPSWMDLWDYFSIFSKKQTKIYKICPFHCPSGQTSIET